MKQGCRLDEAAAQGSFIEFSASTRMSGQDTANAKYRKGSSDAIIEVVRQLKGQVPADLKEKVDHVSQLGGTPLVVCRDAEILGVIYLKDTVKPGLVHGLNGCVKSASRRLCVPATIR